MSDKIDFLKEFIRYVFVGGTAFILDFGTMCIFKELIFAGEHLFIAVFLGYLVGLTYNFLFSNWYVFKNGFEKIKGKEITAFIICAVIGLVGLILTEALMYLFVNLLSIWYVFAKMIAAGIVLFWNYLARKIILYR